MQKSLWKIILICLVLLASPLQGFAGLGAFACAGHHQSLYGDAVASEAHGHHAGDATPAHAVHQKCSACGPCCFGAVMTPPQEPTLALVSGKTDFPTVASRHVSPAIRGLDRPPQTVLA